MRKKLNRFASQMTGVLKSKRAEMFVDKAGWVLITLAIVGLILAAVYIFVDETFLPSLFDKLTDMFSYSG